MGFQTGHIGINVTNVEKAKQFYQDVFGFSVINESSEEGKKFAFLAKNEVLVLTLWEQSEGKFSPKQPGLHHLSFQVDSLEEVKQYEQKLQEMGVSFLYDGIVTHAEGASSGGIFFTDLDGIRLEIYAPKGVSDYKAPHQDAPSCGFF